MKAVNLLKLSLIACFFTLGIAPVFSQTRSIEHRLTAFDAVAISGAFEASITYDEDYAAKITVDDQLEPYVVCYVKGRTLYVEVDDKSIPKEVKKLFRGRNSVDPTFKVQIYSPKVSSITLDDSAVLISSRTIEVEDFNLTLSGSSSAEGLAVTAKKARIEANKKSCLNMSIKAEEIEFLSDGSAKVHLDHTSSTLNATTAGTSDVAISGECSGNVTMTVGNSSKVQISGEAAYLEVNGKGTSAKLDAAQLPVPKARISCSGISVIVNADKELELEIAKGASVTYSGDPVIKVVSIESSSVLRQ